MKYDVTIGIPVYKSVEFIQRSLESALNQTYASIEFLIIDDCGFDGSMDIVEQFRTNHPRGREILVVHHSQNLGVSAARNRIISAAHGDYLYFMDSDDVIADNTIEQLMQAACQYDAEIIFGSYEKIEVSGKKTIYQYPSLQLLKEDELASFAYRKYAGIQASACNYLVKTSLLRAHHHRFIDANYWEDLVFTFDLVTMVKRAVLLPSITYTYLCRNDSLSNYQERKQFSKDEILCNIQTIDHLKKTSSLLYNKVYFPNRCFNIMMTDFYIVCNILKNKDKIQPSFSKRELRDIMKSPLSFWETISLKNRKFENLFLYMLGVLPPSLSVGIITILGKHRGLI
jgi:glycosyltransferase involved in cell wall biosynthesis